MAEKLTELGRGLSQVGDYCECCDPDVTWCLNKRGRVQSAAQRRKEVYAITQRTGERVVSTATGLVGTVMGHYDDDSVYVQIDGEASPSRWWVNDLHLSAPARVPTSSEVVSG